MGKLIYKSIASPEPQRPTVDWSKMEKLTVPDQSLSLQDIIDRFSRNEALPIGKQTSYNDEIEIDSVFAVDLEKLGKADIIEQMEHAEQWKQISDVYKEEEKARNAKKAAEKAKAQKEAEKKAYVDEYKAKMAAKDSTESKAV